MKTFFNLLMHEFNKSLRNWHLNMSTIQTLINFNQINASCLFIYFSELIRSIETENMLKTKYNKLEFTMNSFTSNEDKDNFYLGFQRAQKNYFALLKFVHLWKWKKSSLKVEEDLCGNSLNPSKENCLELLQDNGRYYFSVSDLINICKNALLNISFSFFTEPKIPTNPYTNREFNKSHLFQIYWKIKKSDYKMPMHLQLFYNCFFDIKTLNFKYENLLRDNYIEDFIKTAPQITLRDRILGMIRFLRPYGELNIHDDFPNNILITAMKPFLRMYYISKYSLSHNDEYFGSGQILRNKFKQFCLFNPLFGRKIMKRSKSQFAMAPNERPKFKVTYQTKYIPFHKIELESVLYDYQESENPDYIFEPLSQQRSSILNNNIPVIPNNNNQSAETDLLERQRRLQESQDRLFNLVLQNNNPLHNETSYTSQGQQTIIHEVDSIHNSSSSEGEISDDEEEESSETTLDTNFSSMLNTFLDEINDSVTNDMRERTTLRYQNVNNNIYDYAEDDSDDENDE